MENKPTGDNRTERSLGGDQHSHKKKHQKQQQQPHPMKKAKKTTDKPGKPREKRKEESAAERVKSPDDKHAPEKQALSDQHVKQAPRAAVTRTKATVVAIVGVSALSFLLVLSSALILVKWLRAQKVGTCTTAGCIAHAKAIIDAMNASVQPCSDFYRFSCGSWKPRGPYRSMIEQIFADSFATAIKELEGKANESALPIAQHYYQSCTAKRSQDSLQSEIQKFALFKRDLGLLWPEDWPEKSNTTSVPPLKLLINLTVNWNINLIFKMHLMPGYKGRPRALFIKRGVLTPYWLIYDHKHMKQSIEEHCRYLGASAPTPAVLKQVMDAYLAVVNATLSFEPDAAEMKKTTLKDIDGNAVSGKDKWEEYVNAMYSDFSWRSEDVVFIQHTAILDNIVHLLDSMSDESLRLGIGWVFLRMNFWTIVGKPDLRYEGSAAEVEVKAELACLAHAEATFGLVVSYGHLRERFPENVRSYIGTVFNNVKLEYQRAFTGAGWIDESVKTKLKAKISESLDLDSLPGREFFSNFTIAAIYKDFPNVTESFLDNFVNIAKAFRKKLSSDDFVTTFSKRLGDGHVATSYSYYYNSVYFAAGALEPPLFHIENTFAITYGSLGTLMASSVARAFDVRGITYDKGEESPWWTTGRDEYDRRVKCDLKASASRSASDASRAGPLFLSVLGLRTSYNAFRSAVRSENLVDVYRLEGLEAYSDDQVFFMSYCLMTCAVNGSGDACNVPVRQSSKFASAFECNEGTPMNPAQKCPFF
ncbi:hypothetical protein HPB50_018188 [Hyalomma asiaticum]|uniref:Uncharacterized protein n=1 Tax=Hyalomma asiaticum TaxID=266040 RepID=A0ACB7S0G0_HYAAI|nr:hypothetical protein HPB50_018188 [Hyalomma asiaticum]